MNQEIPFGEHAEDLYSVNSSWYVASNIIQSQWYHDFSKGNSNSRICK